MEPDVDKAIAEQIETIEAQFENAAAALANGDVTKLQKALSIIEKVARIVLVVIGAVGSVKGKK